MSTHKKRKISGLSGLELTLAIQALTSLKNSLIYEEVTPALEDADAGDAQTAKTGECPQEEKVDLFDEHLEGMIRLMQSRLAEPQSFTFSGMTNRILQDDMHITPLGFLDLKDQLEARIQETSLLGQDQLWSSDSMYRHLTMLEEHISRTTEASARAWIDTFFFRAVAMVPPTRRMVLNMEYTVPSTTIRPQSFATISGRTDYTAIIAKPRAAAAFLTSTQLLSLHKYIPSGFFVAEGKSGELARYVPEAVAEIYGCAKIMQKDILRGALTNGREWIFLIVYRKKDGDGATYKESFVQTFDVLHTGQRSPPEIVIVKSKPDLIAGILSYWIEHSFDDISADDWLMDYEE